MLASLSERNRRIVTGILGGALGRSISLLAPFIVMPIILHTLGAYLFGVWMTVLSFTTMALFMDFGIGNGLLTKLSYANGLNNNSEMRAYIISAYISLTVIAFILVSILLLLFFLTNFHFFSLDLKNQEALYIVFASAIIFVLGIPISVIQRIMYAKQQILKFNLWQISGAFFSLFFCYIAVLLKLSSWLIILAYSAPPLIILIIATVVFFNDNKEISPELSSFSKEKSLDLLKIGSKFLVLSILTSIALNIDNVLISFKLGSEAVTDFVVPAKIASLLSVVVTTLFLPLWAANGEAIAKKDYDWVLKTTKKMVFLGALAVFLCSVPLILFNKEIINLWMGHEFKNQQEILIFLCLLSLGMAITSPLQMLLNSLGRIQIQIKIWVIFLFISIALKLIFLDGSALWVVALISSGTYFFIVIPILIYSILNVFKELK
ncbi:oligosaccharide flippase family protein [Acinetobacter sp. TR11]|uniref:oligosaccharide flippase family protein n=1 Tax=Acinetobacter sp. TR11 TaxID=3003393 RepID=UPI0022AC61DD|nr:oligosaccharide flippase family protein [Acinetobacter sp. TR11]WAU73478.1 oligosaccharide flippase family protein [Acinetobacter sp. TR11]